MRRIAVACRWINGVTGTTTGILERTRRFAELGWEVHLYGERLDKKRIRAAGGIPHSVLNLPFFGGLKRKFFSGLFEQGRHGTGFDLLEGHGDTLTQDVLMLHNCVHIAHEIIHGKPLDTDSSLGCLHARLLRERSFRLLIANSEMMKREVMRRFDVPSEIIRVIYPGYDPRRFRAEDRSILGVKFRQEMGIGANSLLVGLVTSGDFKKRGVALFLRSLARLRSKFSDRMYVLIMGKERHMDLFRRLASEIRVGTQVVFLPISSAVENVYHALDIFVYPALYEEFGQCVQEAMACGVPVLTSVRVGAAEPLIKENRGMLLDTPNEEALAQRLGQLITQPELRHRWGEVGASVVRGNTWDRNFQRTYEFYTELLESGSSRGLLCESAQ